MFSYLLFFCVKTHVKLKNVLLQICFCFNFFLVYSSIHRTKNLLSSNVQLRCHATRSSITSYFLEKTFVASIIYIIIIDTYIAQINI